MAFSEIAVALTPYPFPHLVVDRFLGTEELDAINGEWPLRSSAVWKRQDGKNTKKLSTQLLPPAARALVDRLQAPAELAALGRLLGIRDLIADPGMFGAGLHCIERGGHLQVHVDFNQHPRGWHRRVNVLIYLNRFWREGWNGHLELWRAGRCERRIAPLGGRLVAFETNDESWHGHPVPLECPDHVQRRSLALYFYTEAPPAAKAHTTIYRRTS